MKSRASASGNSGRTERAGAASCRRPRHWKFAKRTIIALLIEQGVTVICTGGGGIPVIQQPDGSEIGIEAVVDKDWASALLARHVGADALIMLTDVSAVELDLGLPCALDSACDACDACGLQVSGRFDGAEGGGGLLLCERDRRLRRNRGA
jgi:hypothetical protein